MEVQHDAFLSWCRKGNQHADVWAKAGAAWHLEGTESQRREVQSVTDNVTELVNWVGLQAHWMA
eukprot:3275637-Amphidinium_carterae.1